MVRIERVDLWEEWASGRWAVIPTNRQRRTDGTAVMGAGLAADAAARFGGLDRRYGNSLARGDDRLAVRDHRLLLVPTKHHWRHPSDLTDVRHAAQAVGDYARRNNIAVVVPALGCGLGGLHFDDVAPVITAALADIDAVLIPAR